MAPLKANLVMVQGMQFAGERLTEELSPKLSQIADVQTLCGLPVRWDSAWLTQNKPTPAFQFGGSMRRQSREVGFGSEGVPPNLLALRKLNAL
jgi:hypothetical protein